ncbi:hypothetical protein NDU88_006888 [Pleurodeles waltl]|uniref:Peptidase A2 domain-containing protein n=1 Tax=Pleurodeles waltl TaxID=8319 RepID=A0AAV7TZL5_PLEWA|nr:hypothetical protein NDU88_006888 [Pleurodeles waltl]
MVKYTTTMWLNKEEKNVLIDSGCNQSVVKQDYVQPDQWIPNAQVLITGVHGDRKTYSVATVSSNWGGQEQFLSIGVIPDLGENMIIGTDYCAFAHLLNNVNQDHIANSWWNDAPLVSSEIEEHNTRRKLSKKQKREQKQGYWTNSDPTKPSVTAVPKAIMSIAGRFRQAQREDPTLKNAWQIALAPDMA